MGMKKKLLSSLVIFSFAVAGLTVSLNDKKSAEANATDYYATIDASKYGDPLKVDLYNLIKGHTVRDYDTLEVDMKTTDRDWTKSPNPNDENPIMVILYADYNDTKNITWDKSQGKYGTTTNGQYVWNKEHIWAKSNGFPSDSKAAYSDLHHLRASDHQLNSVRSNNPFANGGSYVKDHFGNTSGCKNSGSTFEPQDQYKGDVARALFYMATRYYNGDGASANLTLTTGTDASGGKWGYLNTLLDWNDLDPVDSFEAHRNDLVYGLQGNRNPYIDHPEFARAVFQNTPIVGQDTLQSLTKSGSPSKTKYKEGESFDPTGLTITATFKKADNTTYTRDVTQSITWSPTVITKDTTSVTGTYSYSGQSMTVTVSGIEVISIKRLEKSGVLTKNTYFDGENFDPTGLTITGIYTDESTEDVTSKMTWLPSPLTLGTTVVVGTLGSNSINIEGITVNESTNTGYSISFKTTSNETTLSTDANFKALVESGSEYIDNFSNISKAMSGNNKPGFRLGNSSTGGTLNINLSNSGKINITGIKISVYKYTASDDTKTQVSIDNSTWKDAVPDDASTPKEVTLTYENSLVTTIYLKTTKRCFISKIELLGNSGGGGSGEFVPVTSLSLDKTTANLEVGQTLTLVPTINPSDATNKTIIWLSSEVTIASVSQSGVVRGLKNGTVTITARTSNGIEATCLITVTGEIIPPDPDPSEPETPDTPSDKPELKGCLGDISTISIILSSLSLIGISLILIKRKAK